MPATLPEIDRDRPNVKLLQQATAGVIATAFAEIAPGIANQVIQALGLEKARRKPGGSPEAIADAGRRAREALIGIDFSKAFEAMVGVVESPLMHAAMDGAIEALKQLGIGPTILEALGDRTASWAHDRAAEMVGMKYDADGKLVPNPNAKWRIDDTTRDMLRTAVTQALEDGSSAEDLKKAILANRAFSETRAEAIARTEIAKADVAGAMTTYRESGLVIGKRWSTAGDDAVSDECEDNEKAGAIPLDALFPGKVDAPPQHVNCRCSVTPVLDGEKLGKAQAAALIGGIHKRARGGRP